MHRHLSVLLLWTVAFLGTPLGVSFGAEGTYFSVAYPPSEKEGELTLGVTYTIWLPPGVRKLRGVIVHQHGCGTGACQGGATAAYDLHWQALAERWDCALMGPSYQQMDGQNCRLWCDPHYGSGEAFLRSLSDLAEQSKHPELKTVPWCLWGHSGGGFWAGTMHVLHPERCVAVWLRSGTPFTAWEKGEVERPVITKAAFEVPVMCNPGMKEKDDARFSAAYSGLLAMFTAYRKHDAAIGFAPDPRTSHECGDSRYLAIPFFHACLDQRLPEEDAKSQQLRPIDRKLTYLGTLLGDQVVPAVAYEGKIEESVWLPNQATADAWKEYVKTGEVSDTTPPPEPTHTLVEVDAASVATITWQASADFESGLQSFIVLRNGREIGWVPEKPVGKFGRPLFQTMSYHDTPEKNTPPMLYVDRRAKPEFKHEYRVIAINGVGLKSEPSRPALSK